jgi:RNA recognition motif-containing protein
MSVQSDYPQSDVSSYRNSYKLFVGCISYDATEEDLAPIFESFGTIRELTVQRSRDGKSKGCAWLKYSSQEACENCIATLSNKYYVNGMRSPIVVKYANTQEDDASVSPQTLASQEPAKLFVGGYPTTASDDEIHRSLSMFGDICEFNRLSRGGVPTGPVFVSFVDRSCALALLNANGATIFMTDDTGQSVPVTLRVSSAFSPVRQANYAPSVTSRASSESPVNSRRPPSVIYPAVSTPVSLQGAKLFVGCLPYSRTSLDLSDVFSQYGPLVEVALLTTPEGKSKGAAFVTFVNKNDAERALSELQGYCFPNSSRGINISFATKQTRPGAPPLSSSASSVKLQTPSTVATEPLTPPGFSMPNAANNLRSLSTDQPPSSGSLFTSYSSDDILKYLASAHQPGADSPYSILRKGSEEHPETDLEKINRDVLSSIFGETNH